MLGIPKILFRTFILSLVLGIAVTCVWYAIVNKSSGADYSHNLPTIIIGAIYYNIILVGMSLPVLFFANPTIRKNTTIKLLLYFDGPVLIIITTLLSKKNLDTEIFYLILTGVYLLIHTFYYFRVVNKLGE
jgi:hypothetical protein